MAAILNVLKYIPVSTARKALEKVNPGFKNYFAKATAYGLDINHAIDFLSDRFQSDSQKAHKSHLEQGQANNTLRPDEAASKAQIANSEAPLKGLKTAASFIGGGLLGREEEDQPMQQNMAKVSPQNQPQQPQNIPQNIQQHLTPMQKQSGVIPKTQGDAVSQYNEIQKRKKHYQELHQEFGDYYGQPEQQTQSASNPRLERLIQLLQQRKQGM